jgi:hypothetical protein
MCGKMDPLHVWKLANSVGPDGLQVEGVCCSGVSAGLRSVTTIVIPGGGRVFCKPH